LSVQKKRENKAKKQKFARRRDTIAGLLDKKNSSLYRLRYGGLAASE
jgi:hypothetical protein